MAKFNAGFAVAFATQTAEGTYNATLDAITTVLTASDGLLLGDPESGVSQSGLSLGLERGKRDKGFAAGSFTRPLSDFLRAEVPTLTFAVPFVGNRADTTATPVDGDFVPLTGIDALLAGSGMVGTAWGSGVGHSYKFGSPNPISALVYFNGNRIECLDCRTTLSISYEAGSIPILTATVEVGSIKNHAVAALPSTLTYGEQATVAAPTVTSVAHQWQDTRGFQSATLNISPTIEAIPDSNQSTGEVKEQTDREVTFEATLFADDTVDAGYEYNQLIETSAGNLDPLSFTVGTPETTGSLPAEAHQVILPTPELLTMDPDAYGTKAGNEVTLIARNATANEELEIIFQ